MASFYDYAPDQLKEMIDGLKKKDRLLNLPRMVTESGQPIEVSDSMHEAFRNYLEVMFARWALVNRQDVMMQLFPQLFAFAAVYFSHQRSSLGISDEEKYYFAHAHNVFSFWGLCHKNADHSVACLNNVYRAFEDRMLQEEVAWLLPEDKNVPLVDEDENFRVAELKQKITYHMQYWQSLHLLGATQTRTMKYDALTCVLKGMGYDRVFTYLNCGFMSEAYKSRKEPV